MTSAWGPSLTLMPHCTPRTELHLNHLAENNVFGIVPLSKVRESPPLGTELVALGGEASIGRRFLTGGWF